MKRVTSLAVLMAMLMGMSPAVTLAAEEQGDPTTWQIGYGETGKVGYLDQNGDWVIAPQYDRAWEFDETGHAIVEMRRDEGDTYSGYGYLYGVIDATGGLYGGACLSEHLDRLWL